MKSLFQKIVVRANEALRVRVVSRGLVRVEFVGHLAQEIESGHSLLQSARAMGVNIPSYCSGDSNCGICQVEVLKGGQNLSAIRSKEEAALAGRAGGRLRLACQSRVLGPVTVRIVGDRTND